MSHGAFSSHKLMHFYYYCFSNAQKHWWMLHGNNSTKITHIYLLFPAASHWNTEAEYTKKKIKWYKRSSWHPHLWRCFCLFCVSFILSLLLKFLFPRLSWFTWYNCFAYLKWKINCNTLKAISPCSSHLYSPVMDKCIYNGLVSLTKI